MTYLLNTPPGGGDYVSRRVADADLPTPYIKGTYPSRGPLRASWEGIWLVLSGGLWFTVDELLSFDPPVVSVSQATVVRLMRAARAENLVSQRPRTSTGTLEYSRNGVSYPHPKTQQLACPISTFESKRATGTRMLIMHDHAGEVENPLLAPVQEELLSPPDSILDDFYL